MQDSQNCKRQVADLWLMTGWPASALAWAPQRFTSGHSSRWRCHSGKSAKRCFSLPSDTASVPWQALHVQQDNECTRWNEASANQGFPESRWARTPSQLGERKTEEGLELKDKWPGSPNHSSITQRHKPWGGKQGVWLSLLLCPLPYLYNSGMRGKADTTPSAQPLALPTHKDLEPKPKQAVRFIKPRPNQRRIFTKDYAKKYSQKHSEKFLNGQNCAVKLLWSIHL